MSNSMQSIPSRVISSTYPEQISQLIDRWQGAAHLVLCGYGGNPKAAYPGWKKASPDPAKAFKHAQNALIGLIPSSVGYTVLDVDDGSPLKLAWGLRPDYVCASGTPGRGHLWFSDDQPRPNSSWTLKSKAGEVFSGEVRSGSGYVVLWDPQVFQVPMDHGHLQARTYAEIEGWIASSHKSLPRNNRVIDRAVDIISQLSPVSYDDWVTVGMCLEGSSRVGDLDRANALTLWRNWSRRAPDKYPGDSELQKKWDSFKGGKPRTLGTLVHRLQGVS